MKIQNVALYIGLLFAAGLQIVALECAQNKNVAGSPPAVHVHAAEPPAAVAADTPAQKIDHRQAVVRVVCSTGPSTDRGTGVLVEGGFVLTANHVVRGNSNSIRVHFQDGTVSPARIVSSDDAYDLAVLKVEKAGAVPVPLSPDDAPVVGEEVDMIGYGPHPAVYREVRCNAISFVKPTESHAADIVELSHGARNGDSGCPVFNRRGEVVGIIWGSKENRAYGACVRRLRIVLARVRGAVCRGGQCRRP